MILFTNSFAWVSFKASCGFIYCGEIDSSTGLPKGKGKLFYLQTKRLYCEISFEDGLPQSEKVSHRHQNSIDIY